MQYIDLTHTFDENMPIYPGDPKPEFLQVASLDHEGYTDYQLKTGMHIGTHMDAPLHMLSGGSWISDLPTENFFGKGHLIDAREKPVTVKLIEDHSIVPGDIVFIMTGFDQYFREPKYYDEYPEIKLDFAKRLVELQVGIVGIDTPSPDRPPFAIHKLLLQNNILIIENLTNLDKLIAQEFSVIALPAKLHTEAAPVRVIATIR